MVQERRPMVLKTFLVEDRPEVRDTLIEALKEITPMHFVGHADTEVTAKQWLSANDCNWDLLILDLFLGEGSGFGVLKHCQTRAATQNVVVLTGYGQQNVLKRCLDLGADQVFDKSQDVEKLVAFCIHHASQLDGSFAARLNNHKDEATPPG